MKKLILLLSFLGIVSISFGQFIPKVGITGSDITYVYSNTTFKPKFGFLLGVAYNKALGKSRFSIQPELLFVQKGAIENYTDIDNNLKIETRLNYLEIPILFKYSIGKAKRFYLTAGPSLGIVIGGHTEFKGTVNGDYFEFSRKVPKFGVETPEAFKRKDFGAQLGGGVLMANRIIVDLRYSRSGMNFYYSTVQLSVGIPIRK
ncbi:MAG: porin family protein [Bacteroidota bacterium]